AASHSPSLHSNTQRSVSGWSPTTHLPPAAPHLASHDLGDGPASFAAVSPPSDWTPPSRPGFGAGSEVSSLLGFLPASACGFGFSPLVPASLGSGNGVSPAVGIGVVSRSLVVSSTGALGYSQAQVKTANSRLPAASER